MLTSARGRRQACSGPGLLTWADALNQATCPEWAARTLDKGKYDNAIRKQYTKHCAKGHCGEKFGMTP